MLLLLPYIGVCLSFVLGASSVALKDLAMGEEGEVDAEATRLDAESLSHPSHLSLSVRDADGNDLSSAPNFTIFHRTVSASDPLTKRSIYPINHCIPNFEFAGSWCTHDISPQRYWIRCNEIGGQHNTGDWGDCNRNQVCIQGPRERDKPPQAYCVDMANFIEVARNRQAGSSLQTNTQPLNVPGPNNYVVSAVLTGLGGVTSVFAKQLSMQAQSYQMIGNVPTWGTLPGGVESCQDCASTVLQPIPVGTKRVSVGVLLKTGTTIAKLYIETILK
ncbi:MAG: hypothetical protein Q9187_004823 [Circinaria calcarea]